MKGKAKKYGVLKNHFFFIISKILPKHPSFLKGIQTQHFILYHIHSTLQKQPILQTHKNINLYSSCENKLNYCKYDTLPSLTFVLRRKNIAKQKKFSLFIQSYKIKMYLCRHVSNIKNKVYEKALYADL